ncbi:Ras-like GTP-binding protein Rho1 [Oopsacas minuta]|uniref:Ras-like GTP-binding protein Rho1 n=1 Tax=Oopsacas minuta TaxID=111878 RepID=A0AAV7JZG8_9METZ|nr:Ras-like GTP-binding protein Rho1 [Oopsacas minuta]
MFRQSNCDLKIILVGDERSGKTCILKRLTEGKYTENYSPTLYDEFVTTINSDLRDYKLNIIELGGSDQCATYRKSCYEESDIILVCFSVVRPYEVLDIGSKWLPEIKKWNQNAYVMLVGTQTDLREDRVLVDELSKVGLKVVTYENGCELVELVKPYKVCGYLECSALNRNSVSQLFEKVTTLTEPEAKCLYYCPSKLNKSFRMLKRKSPKFFKKFHKKNFSISNRFRSRNKST